MIRDWLKRLWGGPTDEEISARSQAAGGPPYPIPPFETRLPTPLVHRSSFVSLPDGYDDRVPLHHAGIPWQQVVDESEAALLGVERRRAEAAEQEARDTRDSMPADPETDRRMISTEFVLPREYPPPADRGTTVNEPTPTEPRIGKMEPERSLGESMRDAGIGTTRAADPDTGKYMVDIHYTPDPVTDSGIHTAQPEQRTIPVTCPTCKGLGHMERTTSELLRESIALIPADGGQQVITEFYRRLLTAAPDLGALFPPDLITAAVDDTASPGRLQRDRLLQALAALADLYGTSAADRQRLDTALRAYGRSHAAFARPDGTVRGATVEEYLVVKQALMDTLHTAARDAWLTEYDSAWAEAYDYAMIVMLHEQLTGGMTFPRQARAAAPSPRPRHDA
jgi:hemoglobin-like flavoprotein